MSDSLFNIDDVAPMVDHEHELAMRAYDAAVARGDVPGTPEYDAWQGFRRKVVRDGATLLDAVDAATSHAELATVQRDIDRLEADIDRALIDRFRERLDALVAEYAGVAPTGIAYTLAADHLVNVARGLRDGAAD